MNMRSNYLFQTVNRPTNFQIIDNKSNDMQLLATKFNSENYQLAYLLLGKLKNINQRSKQYSLYQLYNWNTTSNILALNYETSDWNCTSKCQINASASFLGIQDYLHSFLYSLDQKYLIDKCVFFQVKNKISILDESQKIRKKSDISKNKYVYASGKDLTAIVKLNNTLLINIFQIPQIYNFNPDNFVMDTKLYSNRLLILYRSISTYNIYLYQIEQAQKLFDIWPNKTKLNDTGVQIREAFRFNNNYITKVIRFVRGLDSSTGNQIIWAYNDNEAYKCPVVPCIGYSYQIYNNIAFTSISANSYLMNFYGKSRSISFKNFKPSLISQSVGSFQFQNQVFESQLIAYSNYTINKVMITFSKSLFPVVYKMVDDCRSVNAYQQTNNICICKPLSYNLILQRCTQNLPDSIYTLPTTYIALIVITSGIYFYNSVLFLTLIFIIYRKFHSFKNIRRSWEYNPAQNIIFQ